jgi:protein-tyrosine phosphatase
MPKRILYVCLGNICRSPCAEGVTQALAQQAGMDVFVDSAGTSSYHMGEPADKRMREAAEKRGYQLLSRSRMVSRRDFQEFDLIIAMDRNNYRDLAKLTEGISPKLRLLSDYLDDSWPKDVPDPYHGGDEGFQTVLNMLEAAVPKVLESLK